MHEAEFIVKWVTKISRSCFNRLDKSYTVYAWPNYEDEPYTAENVITTWASHKVVWFNQGTVVKHSTQAVSKG